MNRIMLSLFFGLCGLSIEAQSIMDLLNSGHLSNAQVSLSVIDLSDNAELISHNEDVLMLPASSLKVITTLSTLRTLGEDYRYETKLGYRGSLLSDGTLLGDVILTGSGDPSLASPDENVLSLDDLLADIISSIQAAGISCITGTVYVDGSIFEAEGIHDTWPWDDLTNYYASGAYGFNFYENSYDLYYKTSSSPGQLAEIIKMYPVIPFESFRSLVKSGKKGSGDNAYIYGDPYGYDRYVKGTIPPGRDTFTIHGAIPNPDIMFSELLINQLEYQNIRVDRIPSSEGGEYKYIKTYQSPSLEELVRRANYESNNTYCEAFLKTIGINQANSGVTFEDGIAEVNSILESLDLDVSSLNMQDGSGLSIKNRVSASFFTSFIQAIVKTESIAYVLNYLPSIGQAETTLRRFMVNAESKGNAWLKSGSMGGVQSYTGIIKTKYGKHLAISLISNGHNVGNSKIRRAFAQIIDQIYLQY